MRALAVAKDLAGSATFALRLAKQLFRSMCVPTLEMLLKTENLSQSIAKLSHDHREGVSAFRDKRKAKFTGR